MARAIGTRALGFGLVPIPVSLHSGEARNELERRGQEVRRAELVKGHESA